MGNGNGYAVHIIQISLFAACNRRVVHGVSSLMNFVFWLRILVTDLVSHVMANDAESYLKS